jgi:hypothetical protein
MRGSAHEGERQNAESRAAHILRPFGYGLDDIAELLKHADQETAAFEERARQEQEQGAKRDDVIRRYGGKDKVLAWTREEKLLRAAVANESRFFPPPNQQHTRTIDGCDSFAMRAHTARVIRALSAAYPLPATIAEAEAEYAMWRRRHDELALVRRHSPFKEIQLDLPAELRWQIVANLLETDIRATSITDVFIRQRHYINLQNFRPEIDYAVLKDLERLARAEQKETVQNGQPPKQTPKSRTTASQRRAEVEKLLSNRDTKTLADRQIARQVGVSPQTVGNIRRRMGR